MSNATPEPRLPIKPIPTPYPIFNSTAKVSTFLSCIIHNHTIWISSDLMGIAYASLQYPLIGLVRNSGNNLTKGLFTDSKQNVYMGLYRDSTHVFNKYGFALGTLPTICNGGRTPLMMESFNSVLPISDDSVFIYNYNFIGYYNTKNRTYKDYAKDAALYLSTTGIKFKSFEACLYNHHNGYLGFENKLIHFSAGDNLKTNFIDSFPSGISALWSNKEGFVYVGTQKGLFMLQNNKKHLITSLSEKYIKHIYPDTQNSYWISTSSGLYLIDNNGNIIQSYNEANNGLLNNTVYGVFKRNNSLWGSCNKGLFHIFPNTGKVFFYGINDNIQDNEFNSKTFWMGTDSSIYFGGVNGYNIIYTPQNVLKENTVTELYAIKVNNKPQSFSNSKPIHLNYKQNTLELDFCTVLPQFASDIRYAYRLLPLENDFSPSTHEHIAKYNLLPPGSYTLEVQTELYEHTITKAIAKIIISPPYWQTWWFRISTIILIIGGTYAGIRYYYRQRELRYQSEIKALSNIQRERERISRDLHDNAGSIVTYLIMQLESATEEKINNARTASRNLMNTLRETIWAISDKPITNIEFCDKLVTYCKKYVPIPTSFDLQLTTEEIIPKEKVLNIYRICQEALNNILKHSKASQINLKIASSPQVPLHISIQDNGIGFNAEQTGRYDSFGLNNMQQRAKDATLNLTIESKPNEGTTVIIKMISTNELL